MAIFLSTSLEELLKSILLIGFSLFLKSKEVKSNIFCCILLILLIGDNIVGLISFLFIRNIEGFFFSFIYLFIFSINSLCLLILSELLCCSVLLYWLLK